MIDIESKVLSVAEKTNEQLSPVLEKIFSATVYSKPVVAHDYTVITACEVASAAVFGSGGGFGSAPISSTEARLGKDGSQTESVNGGGSGMGGGGGSSGRPVAVIIIGPEGVSIKPIFDLTKIVLAGITAWITMLTVLRRVGRVGRVGRMRKESKA